MRRRYLCGAVSAYLRQPVDPADIVWRYAGVRPLLDDGASKAQEATRDYVLDAGGTPPLLWVFGGKLTTYRRLAEAAMARLARLFPGMRGAWTAGAPLPGGDFPWDGIEHVQAELARRYPFLAEATCRRLMRAYGTRATDMLGRCQSRSGSRSHFRRRPDRARGGLAGTHRMGENGRGRAVAAEQAWSAVQSG